MNIKTLLTGLVFISLCVAQDINVSGIVTDTSGVPVAGANVILKSFGLNDTTGIDGEFLITDAVTENQTKQPNILHTVKILNGLLFINAQKESLIEVVIYTPQGRVVSKIRETVCSGTNSITLPHIGDGIYFYHIKIDNNKFVLKNNSVGRTITGTAITTNGLTVVANSISVLTVVKLGYWDQEIIIENTNISGVEIKLTARPNMVIDIDGNVYYTIEIGTQEWMISNLRTTRYNDGSPIPMITNDTAWTKLITPGYCYYNNITDIDSIKRYGALYNWYAIEPGDQRKIAPSGWHVPTRGDFDTLKNYLITNGFNWDGTTEGNKIAKSLASNAGWEEPDTGIGSVGKDLSKNNRSGFTAFPSGYRFFFYGDFCGIGRYTHWWSSTSNTETWAWVGFISYEYVGFGISVNNKRAGDSVRLIRD